METCRRTAGVATLARMSSDKKKFLIEPLFWFCCAVFVLICGSVILIDDNKWHEWPNGYLPNVRVGDYSLKIRISELLYHIFAVFLELSLVLWVVEKFLRNYERQQEVSKRKKQLGLIKSVMFRSELKGVYLADFEVLKEKSQDNDPEIRLRSIQSPDGCLPKIHYETLKAWKDELKSLDKLREDPELHHATKLVKNLVERFNEVIDGNPELKKRIIDEYVNAQKAWSWFKEFAVTCNLEGILDDIIEVEHLNADTKAGRENKGRLRNVWLTGIKKFVDYSVELMEPGSETNQKLFKDMMKEYVEAEAAQTQKEAEGKRISAAHQKVMEEGLPKSLSPLH